MNNRYLRWTGLAMGAGLLAATPGLQAGAMNALFHAQMVPYATYTTGGASSVVGLLARSAGTLHWAFYDANGNRRHRGNQPVDADEFVGFNWSTEAGGAATNLSGVEGFLLFALDSDGDGQIGAGDARALSSNAIHLDTANADVVYIPTIPLDESVLSSGNPDDWTNNPVTALSVLSGTLQAGHTLDAQYLIDGAAGGDDTKIIIWSTSKPPATSAATLHDGAGATKTIDLETHNNNLNVVNLEASGDMTATFHGAGYLRWPVPAFAGNTYGFAFSLISSPTFGAVQTMMGHVDY
jgi:hypothetical protein